jgi:uncharacterized MAPEG superfamily protein
MALGGAQMTIAYWCVLIAGLLPYVATVLAKSGTRFDNHLPRDWLATQTGWRKRANAAQLNGFEAFPLFAAAVVIAHLTGGNQGRVDLLAMLFIAARIAYLAAYVADLATLRSLIWFVGIGSSIAILVSGA